MMHRFISNNRDELLARCKAKVANRPQRAATEAQLRNGIPLFLDQLQRTLEAEEADDHAQSLEISGASGGLASSLSEIGVSATAHGKQLLELGFTVDQVVHDYGDLCQAITDLAVERDAPFGVNEFRTLNRCLDNAIADAVTEFSFQRDASAPVIRTGPSRRGSASSPMNCATPCRRRRWPSPRWRRASCPSRAPPVRSSSGPCSPWRD